MLYTFCSRRFALRSQVVEVGNGDWLTVATPSGEKKVFLASIRAPKCVSAPLPIGSCIWTRALTRSHDCECLECVCERLEDTGATSENAASRVRAMSRPLFDVPCVFEAREMLRKKVLGREVNVSIDYVLPKSEQSNMPERHCCTVMFGTTCALILSLLVYEYSYLMGEPKRIRTFKSHYAVF